MHCCNCHASLIAPPARENMFSRQKVCVPFARNAIVPQIYLLQRVIHAAAVVCVRITGELFREIVRIAWIQLPAGNSLAYYCTIADDFIRPFRPVHPLSSSLIYIIVLYFSPLSPPTTRLISPLASVAAPVRFSCHTSVHHYYNRSFQTPFAIPLHSKLHGRAQRQPWVRWIFHSTGLLGPSFKLIQGKHCWVQSLEYFISKQNYLRCGSRPLILHKKILTRI